MTLGRAAACALGLGLFALLGLQWYEESLGASLRLLPQEVAKLRLGGSWKLGWTSRIPLNGDDMGVLADFELEVADPAASGPVRSGVIRDSAGDAHDFESVQGESTAFCLALEPPADSPGNSPGKSPGGLGQERIWIYLKLHDSDPRRDRLQVRRAAGAHGSYMEYVRSR